MNLILRDIFNPKNKEIPRTTRYDDFLFRIGDRVYRTVNKYEEDILHANGEVGIIKELIVKREFNKVTKEFEDRPTNVIISHGLEGLADELVTIQELYQDFALDYCKTIHKCQGSQYDNIVLFMSGQHNYMWSNDESRNLLYTAISRAKQKCYIIGNTDGKLLRAAQFDISGKLKVLQPRVSLVFKESENYSIE
jgi:exodeoxyribonuclease V alpha subunit